MAKRIFCWKLLKCLRFPMSRLKKLKRGVNMKQLKLHMALMVASSSFVSLLIFLWNINAHTEHNMPVALKLKTTSMEVKELKILTDTPMRHIPLNEFYGDQPKQSPNDSIEFYDTKPGTVYMIDTPGCKIPVLMINYEKYLKSGKMPEGSCGKRAVFMNKVDRDKVRALIKPKIMKKYLRKSIIFDCCYRFIKRSPQNGYENKKIKFTRCIKFKDRSLITLQTDFINVKCFDYDKRNVSHIIYDDVYAFAKSINVSKHQDNCSVKFNVLMIGMDSMSLPRFSLSLSRTVHYFQDNFWLGFRGYHKVEDNTFPNLMAALTGKDLLSISKKCSGKMDQCHDLFIWDKFKKAGYVTAYGEDYLRLPDTFTNKYAFKVPPTDHYMRPFFLKGETEMNNKSLVCAGKSSSGQQLLNYALDFANTYRSDNFFGLFWINSFSHNINSRPHDADTLLENFFNQLTYTGVMKNTFVIVFSDHGLRFGDHRLKMESYYDERLPFLFVWSPKKFNGRHPDQFKSLAINQFRLVTPYDLYNTLVSIKDISLCRNTTTESISEACPKCHNIFEVVSENRTCQDVGIHDKWCTCHNLYPLPAQDSEGEQSVLFVVSYIRSMIKSIQTNRCWGCMSLSLKNILRMHFYYNNDKVGLFYVVAFAMTPGNMSYEATVLLKDGKREMIGPVSVISPYRGLGKCTLKPRDRLFCLCQRVDNC